jgi:hypothetical protein
MTPARGSASMLIDLKGNSIRVYHGTDKNLLAEKVEAESGDWDKLWKALEGIGIKSLYKGRS